MSASRQVAAVRRVRSTAGLLLAIAAATSGGAAAISGGAAAASAGAAAPRAAAVRAVVFADFNGPYGSTTYPPPVAQVVARIAHDWRPDLVLAPGDLVAGQKADLPDDRFPEMWRAFDSAVAAPLRGAGIPFAFALGNHDASAARGTDGRYLFARERDHAAAYWRNPAHRPRLDYRDVSRYPFAYTFVVRGIFVVALDATSAVIQDSDWVLAALRTPEARRAQLRVVMGHLPLYGISVGRSRAGEVVEEGETWRRHFEALGVDLYISGHHAAYYPAHRGALRLLHAGGVGARPYVGHPDVPSRSTVTVLRIDLPARSLALETFDVDTWRAVPLSALPACLDGYNGAVFRLDLPQRAACTTRI